MDSFHQNYKDKDIFFNVGITLGIGDIWTPPKGPPLEIRMSSLS